MFSGFIHPLCGEVEIAHQSLVVYGASCGDCVAPMSGGWSVISCERWKDGFVMTVEGLRLLRHSSAFPAIFLGMPREKAALSSSAGSKNGKGLKWRNIGPCSILNEGPNLIVLGFASVLTVRISYMDRVLHLGFSFQDEAAQGIRLRLGAKPGERLFGAGPSTQYDMKKKMIKLFEEDIDLPFRREPTIMSTSGSWIHVEGTGSFVWNFGASITELSCLAMPAGIALGFGKNPAMGLELLTRYKAGRVAGTAVAGRRRGLPGPLLDGIVLDARECPPDISDFLDRIRERGIDLAAVILDPVEGLEMRAGAMEPQEWENILAGAQARALPPGSENLRSAGDLVRRILSLAFSGEGHVFMSVEEGTDGRSAVGDSLQGTGSSRAFEIAAFGPVFLASAACAYDGDASERRLLAAAAIYGIMGPYRRHCSEEWEKSGIPALVHPAVYYPEENVLWHCDDQYMFGPDVLIAPTMGGGVRARILHLPDDDWVHLWTSRRYSKGRTVVEAPPGKPAVFYRSGSAFAPLFETLRQKATRL